MFKEVFISYGRRESLNFVARLHQSLKLAGYETWFDKVNIPDGEDYALRISQGIESAHNFIYVMAPRALCSPYCLIELEYARWLGKRVIPINQMVIFSTEDAPLSAGDCQVLADFYQRYDIDAPEIRSTQQVLERSLAQIGRSDWLDGKNPLDEAACQAMASWAQGYENYWHQHADLDYLKTLDLPVFGDVVDTPESIFTCLEMVLKRQRDYVLEQSALLQRALAWREAQEDPHLLLVGKARQAAAAWLMHRFEQEEQAPCIAGVLLCDFLSDSRKHAENLGTDVFICYDRSHRQVRQQILYHLAQHHITTWRHDQDIEMGESYAESVLEGVLRADNFIYLLSPATAASANCQLELQYALQYNKRLIPLSLNNVPSTDLNPAIAALQAINYQAANALDELLGSLCDERDYYHQHKRLLSLAYVWQQSKKNSAFLLRGHHLDNAHTWLRLQQKRQQHTPIALHQDFILASEAARGTLDTDVFIAYSRKDSDFACKLNFALQSAGKTTWFDQENITAGMDFEQELYRGISAADNFVFIISPYALDSAYCHLEVNYAVQQGKRLLTVLSAKTDADSLPTALQTLNWIDFLNTPFETAFQNLIQSLDIDQTHVHLHTKIQQRAFEWQSHQASRDFLLNHNTCDKAEAWLQSAEQTAKHPQPTAIQKAYIKASRTLISQRQLREQRRHQRIFAVLALGLVMALSLASFAWVQKNKAIKAEQQAISAYKRAQAHYLATVANDLIRSGDMTRAIRVAESAYETDPEHIAPAVEQALSNAYHKVVLNQESAFYQNILPHPAELSSAIYSPDGAHILTAATDGQLRLWTSQGQAIRSFEHGESVRGAIYSPDGAYILSFGAQHSLKLWDKNGDLIHTLHGHGCEPMGHCMVNAVAFAPDSQHFVSVGDDYAVLLWDIKGKQVAAVPNAHPRFVTQVSYSADGQYILSASKDYGASVKLWRAEDLSLISQTDADDCTAEHSWECGFNTVQFHPDGKHFITASQDHSIRFFNLASEQQQRLDGHQAGISHLSFNPDLTEFASGSHDGEIIIWDLQGQIKRRYIAHKKGIRQLHYGQGNLLLSASDDHSSKLWHQGRLLGFYSGHESSVKSAVFAPNHLAMLSASADNTARLWLLKYEAIPVLAHTTEVAIARFSPDKRYILSASHDLRVRLWDANTYQLLKTYAPYGSDIYGNRRIYSLNLHPDGKRFITSSADYQLRLVNIDSGEIEQAWDGGHRDHCTPSGWCGVINAIYDASGTQLLSSDFAGEVALWSQRGDLVKRFQAHEQEVRALAFHPQQAQFATGSHDKTIKLWRKDGQLLTTLSGHRAAVLWLSFSPDGKQLASASEDQQVRLWNLATGENQVLSGHAKSVRSVEFSPDGKQLISASEDGTAKWWRNDGGLIKTLRGHDDLLRSAVFSVDGRAVLTSSKDGTVRIWPDTEMIYQWLKQADIYQLSSEERAALGG